MIEFVRNTLSSTIFLIPCLKVTKPSTSMNVFPLIRFSPAFTEITSISPLVLSKRLFSTTVKDEDLEVSEVPIRIVYHSFSSRPEAKSKKWL